MWHYTCSAGNASDPVAWHSCQGHLFKSEPGCTTATLLFQHNVNDVTLGFQDTVLWGAQQAMGPKSNGPPASSCPQQERPLNSIDRAAFNSAIRFLKPRRSPTALKGPPANLFMRIIYESGHPRHLLLDYEAVTIAQYADCTQFADAWGPKI
jgi:hypothetical protein